MSDSILLVEDDAVLGTLVSRHLQDNGYRTHHSYDAEAAQCWLARHQPVLILCDLKLPGQSGLELLEWLQCQHPAIPVIVLSGSERLADIREAVRLGASDYLVKPLQTFTELDDSIQQSLQREQLESAWDQARWEFDDHLGVLLGNQRLQQHLSDDLMPREPLHSGAYRVDHEMAPADSEPPLWLDYQRLPEQQALIVMAREQSGSSQAMVSLLLLRAMVTPLIRSGLRQPEKLLQHPGQLLERINIEVSHARMRSIFDFTCIWLDTRTGQVRWAQAGESLRFSLGCRTDLALGIWQHYRYREHRMPIEAHGAELRYGSTALHIRCPGVGRGPDGPDHR